MYFYTFLVLILSFTFEVTESGNSRSCSLPSPAPKPGGSYRPRKSKYRVGTVVSYVCKDNYKLLGVRRRKCLKNGKWDPQGKKTRCDPIGCSEFPSYYNVLSSASHTGTIFPFESVVNYSCLPPLELQGPRQLVCSESGRWQPEKEAPRCILSSGCLSPPGPPKPRGWSSADSRITYQVGARVNYSCPRGYGLDGIPYRICNSDGRWLPPPYGYFRCKANFATCPDPGIPENGLRIVQSFGDGHLASFSCKQGYKQRGSSLRTCHASDLCNTFWDGDETICIDMFKSPNELAAQLRETFIDRTLSCDRSDDNVGVNASEQNNTITDCKEKERSKSTDEDTNTFCLGRTVVLGEGCVDLIYAIDCSRSMKEAGFNQSKEFVLKTIRLFELDKGKERVCLITYDNEAYLEFCFEDVNSTSEAMARVRNATFCGGATSTTRLIEFIVEKIVHQTRSECKKALFIISDGENNWKGDPEKKARRLKSLENFEIYTIAIGDSWVGWDSLKRLASGSEHFFAVRDAENIKSIVSKAIKVPPGLYSIVKLNGNKISIYFDLDYGRQCGRVAISEDPCRDNLNSHCRSSKGAWPWMVGIYILETSKIRPEIICGGVLIGNCYVLTAAHCLFKRPYQHLLVVIGNTDRSINDGTEETIVVEEVILHDLFNEPTLDYDIALLKLSCNVSYSSYGKRICLPDCVEDGHLYGQGKLCTVAGWGTTNIDEDGSYKMSTHLHHIHLPIANPNNCEEKSDFPITDTMICAGDASGQEGVCKGDSGGPLFSKGDYHDRWVLLGIVSWGEGCRQAHKYDIFTNICSGNITTWIDEQMFLHPCPQCTGCSCKDPIVNIV